jgi:hypothetical protein
MNEDKAFATACKLEARFLDIPCASFLGHPSFDLSWLNQNTRRIALPLLNTLINAAGERRTRKRSWLFCPAAVGSHIDHAAVKLLVIQNYNLLSLYYRIGFYEDLHYASDATVRALGVDSLRKELRYQALSRYAFPFPECVLAKLTLISMYNSQFIVPPSIDRFTPATETPIEPHEAIWSAENLSNK